MSSQGQSIDNRDAIIATLRADLARVTQERNSIKDVCNEYIIKSQHDEGAIAALNEAKATLRATISALEGELSEKLANQRRHLGEMHDETIAELDRVRNVAKSMIEEQAARIKTLEAGIAERDAAIKVAWQALEISRLMVRNEMMCCEVANVHPGAWPDLLTGCVSGGGIEAALAALAQCREEGNASA